MHFTILVAIASRVQALPSWFCLSCVADVEKTLSSSERATLQRINSATFRADENPLVLTEKVLVADKQRRLSSLSALSSDAMSAPLPKITAPGKVGAAASEGSSNSGDRRMFKKVIILPPTEVGPDGKLFFPPPRHFEN